MKKKNESDADAIKKTKKRHFDSLVAKDILV
jgi:hypothetical protein